MDFFSLHTDIARQLPWQLVFLACTLAFLLGQIMALTYEHTYQGMSYSRSLFQTLVLCSILSCMLMFAVGNNLARGLGIAGVFAIIRFRTNLRDPRDIVFVFASMLMGIATGILSFALAFSGAFLFVLAAFYLRYVPVGTRQAFDGLLRFSLPAQTRHSTAIEDILRGSCERYALVTLREFSQGERLEYAYQVKLRDSSYSEAIVYMMQQLPQVAGVSLMMQETTVEL